MKTSIRMPVDQGGLLRPTSEQISNVRRWNEEYQWGFIEEDFGQIASPPSWAARDLTAVILVPYLQTVGATFNALRNIVSSRQPNSWLWGGLRSAENVRLYPGIEHKPGLRWEIIDLASNWDKRNGIAPASVREASTSPHAGILAAAAHYPEWVRNMDGENIPFVWLPGYQVWISVSEPWQGVPCIGWFPKWGEVSLYADWEGDPCRRYAIPVFKSFASDAK